MNVLLRGMMSASLIEWMSVDEQLQSLTTLLQQLQQEVCELRRENGELRQQVRDLRRDVGYWKSMHELILYFPFLSCFSHIFSYVNVQNGIF